MTATIPFVGRDSELDRLEAILDRALNGGTSVAFITGEAGAGKSALLSAFARRVQARDGDLVFTVGDCNAQTGISDPYLPFKEVLGQLTGDVEAKLNRGGISEENAGRLTRLWETSGRALVESAPDLVDVLVPGGAILARLGQRALAQFPWARRLAEISEGRIARRGALEGLDQNHIFEQYTALLKMLAARHPLVLVLDDLHWVDPASASLLFHLARRLDRDPILILGAYRPGDVLLGWGGERHPLDQVLNELRRYQGEITVEIGEGADSGRQFVDALLAVAAPGVDEVFQRDLFHHTGGHPLFTVELLRHLKEQGALVEDAAGRWRGGSRVDWSALPARIEGLIEEQANRLEPGLREILAVASVEGEQFTAEVIGEVLSREPRDVVRDLSGPLEKRHRLVRSRGVGRVGGQRMALYEFRHNLFQTWFYHQLDPVERVYLHESVGRALEALYASSPAQVAVRLARHFVEAEESEAALRYLLLAGEQAAATLASQEAAQRYAEAAQVLERARGRLDPELARESDAQIEEALGDLAELAGHHDEAMNRYQRAAAVLKTEDTVRRARLSRKQAKPLEIQGFHPEAAERLREAEALLGDPPPADVHEWWDECLQIQIERVWVHYWRGNLDQMEGAARRVRALVERQGTPVQRARFYFCEALLAFRRERFHPSEATLATVYKSLEASRQGGALKELGSAHFVVGFTHTWRLELDEGEPHLEKAREIAEKAGDLALLSRIFIYLSLLRRFRGDVLSAEQLADRAEHASKAVELREYLGTIHAQRSWVAFHRGNLRLAREEAETALGEWNELAYPYPMRSLGLLPLMAVEAEEGNPAGAAALAAELLQPPLIRLPDPLWSDLQRVVEASAAGAEAVAAAVRIALRSARAVGYL